MRNDKTAEIKRTKEATRGGEKKKFAKDAQQTRTLTRAEIIRKEKARKERDKEAIAVGFKQPEAQVQNFFGVSRKERRKIARQLQVPFTPFYHEESAGVLTHEQFYGEKKG